MKPLLIVSMLACGVFLSGCSLVAKQADVATETPTKTFTGKLTTAGGLFYVTSGSTNTEVTSRKIDLKQFEGKMVTVTGEFSGTTLFVDTIR